MYVILSVNLCALCMLLLTYIHFLSDPYNKDISACAVIVTADIYIATNMSISIIKVSNIDSSPVLNYGTGSFVNITPISHDDG